MARLRKSLWTIAAIVALPAPAAAQEPPDVCDAIARIAAAARERPPFNSIRRALAAEQAVIPGFEADECSATAEGVSCQGRRFMSAFHNWPDLATCRGVSAVEPPLPRRQGRWPSNRSYRLGRFLIARGVRCPGCAALGPSYFIMRLERRRGPRP